MENPVSTPLCSFVVYLNQDAELAPAFLKDVRSFFTKLPIQYEVVFVFEFTGNSPFPRLEDLSSGDQTREKITILNNSQRLKRAESLRQGFNHAQGEYLIVADVAMQTPLGDLFKILQHLMTEDELQICWGERYSKKNNSFVQATTSRHALENLFNKILQEKLMLENKDILCETLGMRKSSWQKIDSRISRQSGWYLAPALRHSCKIHSIAAKDVFVHDSGNSSRSYSLWSERWNLFKLALKGL